MVQFLHLLRHGETAAHGRLVGSTDIPVDAGGYAQLQRTRDKLKQMEISFMVSSPMQRCLQTTRFLQMGMESVVWSDLREIDFGAWENHSFQEIAAKWPDTVNAWSNWSESFTFPDGENIGDFLERMKNLQQKIARCEQKDLLVVTHGGVIRHLICLYLGIAPEKYLLFDIRPGCFSTLALHSEGGVLISLNRG